MSAPARFATMDERITALRSTYRYSPNQPRVPSGDPAGGEWTDGGGGSALVESGATIAAARKADSYEAMHAAMSARFPAATDREDTLLLGIAADRGFTDKPEVVSASELDAHIAAGDHELYRGIARGDYASAAPLAEEFRSGRYYAGTGAYGNGTYAMGTADGKDAAITVAKAYANSGTDKGVVLRMALRRDANVTTYSELARRQEAFLADLRLRQQAAADKILAGPSLDQLHDRQRTEMWFYEDVGRYAAAAGYDGYWVDKVPGVHSYFVALNRGVLRVQRENYR